MTELASMGQLRGSLLRWTLVLVPALLLLGMLSAQLAGSGAENAWFASLAKPPLYPPAPVFPLVWTILYILMGLALALVASARGAQWRTAALVVFGLQLALNLVWSPLFFAGHQILAALVLLVVLDLAVIATIVLFRLVRPVAALLLLPYLAWLLFATLLTWQIYEANPGADGREVSGAVTRIQI
jgi:tryptophan-rich sensory protein